MSDWAMRLRRASFRGVSFWVESDSRDGGKRLGRHEYAGGYATRIEEMGAATEQADITAYLASDLADIEAAALMAACRQPGPGLLCLPMDLPFMAFIEQFSRLRQRDRAGYIAFGLTAVPDAQADGAPLGLGDLSAAFSGGFAGAAAAFGGLFV